jgi:hypothetical protein
MEVCEEEEEEEEGRDECGIYPLRKAPVQSLGIVFVQIKARKHSYNQRRFCTVLFHARNIARGILGFWAANEGRRT